MESEPNRRRCAPDVPDWIKTMDYEEISALVHSALKGMHLRLEADPSYENQMASDMQRNTIFSLVENAAKKEGRIQPTESLGQIDSGFVS